MEENIQGKYFSMKDRKDMNTVIYQVNKTEKEFLKTSPKYTVERLDYIEEIDSFEEGWMSGYSHYWTRELKDNEMRRFVKNEGPILSPEEQEDYSAALGPYMVEPPENDTEFNKPLPPVDWSAMDFVNNTKNLDDDLDEGQTEENESDSKGEEQESLNESKMSDEEKSRLDKSVNLNGWTEKDDDDESENEERKRIEAAEEDEEFKDATL